MNAFLSFEEFLQGEHLAELSINILAEFDGKIKDYFSLKECLFSKYKTYLIKITESLSITIDMCKIEREFIEKALNLSDIKESIMKEADANELLLDKTITERTAHLDYLNSCLKEAKKSEKDTLLPSPERLWANPVIVAKKYSGLYRGGLRELSRCRPLDYICNPRFLKEEETKLLKKLSNG